MLYRKNVFILGAGFSADAGAPVMRDFLRKAWVLLDDPDSGLEKHHRDVFEKIRRFLQKLKVAEADVNLDLENIEQLFGLAEMDLQFGAGESENFRREDIAFLITQTLERSFQQHHLSKGAPIVTREPPGPHNRQIDAHYGELFAGLASRRWVAGSYAAPASGLCQDVIITMNYDCFLDDILLRLGVRPDYGFERVGYYESEPKDPRSVQLLKLHGSTNWFICTDGSCLRRGIQIWGHDLGRRLDYLYWNTPCHGCSRLVEPLIVPPTWAKPGHSEMLAPVWKRALDALREAEQICIIGYSMPDTDAFFKYMLGLSIAGNAKLAQIVVVNRNDSVLENYKKLFNENFRRRKLIFPHNRTAAAFINNGDLGRMLGQYGDGRGLDPNMIRESGFTVS